MTAKTSFIDVHAASDFPLENLPYGVFSVAGSSPRVGVAIGEQILDLSVLEQAGLLQVPGQQVFGQDSLNAFIALGPSVWQATRARLQGLLALGNNELQGNTQLRAQALVPQAAAQMHLPVSIGGYTDFYSSKEHAFNVGCMFRGAENALMPNWTELPVGYNGRASSVVVSGTDIVRPSGQVKAKDAARPEFKPCAKLDFELETGFIVGRTTSLGEPVSIADAPAHIFGMVLLNDWSARDIQQWEYVPLGPFNAKTFGTSISPWVVTMQALEPFRCANQVQDPKPLAYLQDSQDNNYDIKLEVAFAIDGVETVISRTNFKHMYWTMAQQLTHHSVSGCNLQVGDLMGSGTISGPDKNSFGSLLELTWNGQNPLQLAGGVQRSFIQDNDSIVMRGHCEKNGLRLGFGEVRGKILPALAGTYWGGAHD